MSEPTSARAVREHLGGDWKRRALDLWDALDAARADLDAAQVSVSNLTIDLRAATNRATKYADRSDLLERIAAGRDLLASHRCVTDECDACGSGLPWPPGVNPGKEYDDYRRANLARWYAAHYSRVPAETAPDLRDNALPAVDITALIEASSLGDPEAKAARESVPYEVGLEVARRAAGIPPWWCGICSPTFLDNDGGCDDCRAIRADIERDEAAADGAGTPEPGAGYHRIVYAAGTLDDGTYGRRAHCGPCSGAANDYVEDCAVLGDQIAAYNRRPIADGTAPPTELGTEGANSNSEAPSVGASAGTAGTTPTAADEKWPQHPFAPGRGHGLAWCTHVYAKGDVCGHRQNKPIHDYEPTPTAADDIDTAAHEEIAGTIPGVTGYTVGELRAIWADMRAYPHDAEIGDPRRLAVTAIGLEARYTLTAQRLDTARAELVGAREEIDKAVTAMDRAEAEAAQVNEHMRRVAAGADARKAETERLATERQEEAFLRIGAEAMVEEFREQRDSARGLAAALEAESAEIRALDLEAHCDCGKSYILTGEVLAVLDRATSEVCAEPGCAAAVHRQGWRCDAHVPPCGFRAHTAGCSCSRNECAPDPRSGEADR